MTSPLFDKTDKGREEIATRKYHLAPRLRTLLLLIDGKHSVESLLKQVAGLGLSEQSLNELAAQGFIRAVAEPEAATPTAPTAPRPVRAGKAAAGVPVFEGLLPDGQTQFQAIYFFYLETIKNLIGLRGYALQHKVERAATVPELRELRQACLEAVQKTKGRQVAEEVAVQLDALLYYGVKRSESITTG